MKIVQNDIMKSPAKPYTETIADSYSDLKDGTETLTLNCAPTVGFLVAGIPWRVLLSL